MNLFLGYLLPLLFGFAVGSVPTTYLLVKWRKRVDIRREGTGNVGAMNAFEVTGSAKLGVAAMVVDGLKGAAAVLLAWRLFGDGFWIGGIAGVAAVTGHNYSPWIGFKGGRGLAPAFGVSMAAGWLMGVLWLAFFGLVYLVRREIHTANLTASVLMPGVITMMPTGWVNALVPGVSHADLAWISLALCTVILFGHFKIIVNLLKPSYHQQ